MSDGWRRARVPAFAKLNLSLRVLPLRPDGYHELRTVFQTISLADTLDIAFLPGRKTSVQVESNVEIADNIVSRAARLCLKALRAHGRLELRLEKKIPLGAGLGGGSSDAAAVLLSLPVLVGRPISLDSLIGMGADLGSDVPFFLLGGAALGVGRGTELYPLPDVKPLPALVVAPDIHISTAEAYRALDRLGLTTEEPQNKINRFQSWAWGGVWDGGGNDFEAVAFPQFPRLKVLKGRLQKLGAKPARMTGSGSALFGIFRTRDELTRATQSFREENVYPISLVSRVRYRSAWWRRLQAHIDDKLWPPQSRYAR